MNKHKLVEQIKRQVLIKETPELIGIGILGTLMAIGTVAQIIKSNIDVMGLMEEIEDCYERPYLRLEVIPEDMDKYNDFINSFDLLDYMSSKRLFGNRIIKSGAFDVIFTESFAKYMRNKYGSKPPFSNLFTDNEVIVDVKDFIDTVKKEFLKNPIYSLRKLLVKKIKDKLGFTKDRDECFELNYEVFTIFVNYLNKIYEDAGITKLRAITVSV